MPVADHRQLQGGRDERQLASKLAVAGNGEKPGRGVGGRRLLWQFDMTDRFKTA
jgi:hypothetical protein